MSEAVLLSVQVGLPRTMDSPTAADGRERSWKSGICKYPVAGQVWLGPTNLAGDGQADLRVHGGPNRAVNVYASEHYAHWRTALSQPDFPHGAFGENFTTQGLLEDEVSLGDIYRVGDDVYVQVSQPRGPCWKLERRWGVPDLADQVQALGATGWYLRVLREGLVGAGMPIQLVERPNPDWTITWYHQATARRKPAGDTEEALRWAAEYGQAWQARHVSE